MRRTPNVGRNKIPSKHWKENWTRDSMKSLSTMQNGLIWILNVFRMKEDEKKKEEQKWDTIMQNRILFAAKEKERDRSNFHNTYLFVGLLVIGIWKNEPSDVLHLYVLWHQAFTWRQIINEKIRLSPSLNRFCSLQFGSIQLCVCCFASLLLLARFKIQALCFLFFI